MGRAVAFLPSVVVKGETMTAGPVLLLGAGRGEATCGLLYIASFLQRHGVDARVRLCDPDQDEQTLTRSLEQLIGFVRPRLVGISLKWYLHSNRAFVIARAVRRIDPSIRIVFGGNTAALYWREVLARDCVDDVVLGDGEVPMLALARGDAEVPNLAQRDASGRPVKLPFTYVQNEANDEVYYSHFDQLFLSEVDRQGFSGWVAPGKGCSESCVYCGGRRAAQRLSFGRAQPFLRSVPSVRRDHEAISRHVWQFRYDFPGGSSEYLCDVWPSLDLSGHKTTYFLWGLPAPRLVEVLAQTFERVFMVLDIGCFSNSQRDELMKRSLLKPCPSDAELLAAVDQCLKHSNLELEVAGIAGLPCASKRSLAEEHDLIQRLLEKGCKVGYQRLQSQPGALVTEHADRFGMVTEAQTFDDYVNWFSRKRKDIPLVRFKDPALERAVRSNCERLDERLADWAEKKSQPLTARTLLRTGVAARREVSLGDWLGTHRVPTAVARTQVTVLRSHIGGGLACAPSLSPERFEDPALQQGDDAGLILSALASFEKSTTVERALARHRDLDPELWFDLVDHLESSGFLVRA